MAKQTTLYGDVIEHQPVLKQRRSGSYKSESNEDLCKRREVFKEAWKEKTLWPRLHGIDVATRSCNGYTSNDMVGVQGR